VSNPGEPINIALVRNVTQPSITVYLPSPEIATGTAVVICPGGAFHFLAIEHEGTQVAEWFTARGIVACILRYRLIETAVEEQAFLQRFNATMADRQRMRGLIGDIVPLISADGQQAVRLIRKHAATWGVVPDRVGILGFSAGGVVTTCVATQYDAESRPNFAAPIYSAPLEGLVVPADAPPLFMVLAHDDQMAIHASLGLYNAWQASGHSAELHIYAQGGHGFGMRKQNLPADHWIDVFADWMHAQGY
jgi:acetyl esterase/lipase